MTDDKKTYFDVIAYSDKKRTKVGYAYETESGKLCVRAEDLLDSDKLGRLMQKGLYIETRKKKN